MKIEYITCSGICEHNNIEEIVALGKKYQNAEFAVQTSRDKLFQHSERYEFFRTLVAACTMNDVNLAMHVNLEYRTDLCRGIVPEIFRDLWNIRRCDGMQRADKPVIGRVQININGGQDTFRFNARKLAEIIRAYPDIKFILQYAPKQRKRVFKLDDQGVPFSLLYDVSGGEGKLSRDSWGGIILPGHPTGYAGGLSPDNVVENLNYINTLVPPDYVTWIDAEGKLKSPGPNGKNLFDLELAEQYIRAVYGWQMEKGYNK